MSSFNLWWMLCALSCSSCISQDGMVVLHINDARLSVEIADTEEERSLGLMFRDMLPEGRGMLFVFENDAIRNFWMRNTSIPLSIAFIDVHGIILEIHDMEPFSLETISSQHPVRYALEVNQGVFEQYHINVGDRVLIPDMQQ